MALHELTRMRILKCPIVLTATLLNEFSVSAPGGAIGETV